MSDRLLHFRISSALKDIIGRDLITDDFIAVFELVKNAYDAHASRVDISFIDIYTIEPKIVINDNGKGMNYQDLIDKWLFVAYSAKREGTEDDDYRHRLLRNRPFAGAKGIGRFSCDRLGKILQLETIKDEVNPQKQLLTINWENFENDLKDEFVDIAVEHDELQVKTAETNGTKLTITHLRNDWDRSKLLDLKKSLAKLINPSSSSNDTKFEIWIHCKEEASHDQGMQDYHDIVNGEVKNFIFETLEIKTTKISVDISEDGMYTQSELRDGGTMIYKIKEKNAYDKLKNISFNVFYLNQSAKNTFSRRMGINTKDYGSIFLYKNNIRIYPFGEPGEDPLELDKRKAQKASIYLGNKDLIGRIEIKGINDDFRETSSRGDGFIKNEAYRMLLDFVEEYVIRRLEKYVIDVQKWGEGIYLSIEDDLDDNNKSEINGKIINLISKLTNGSNILEFTYNESFLRLINSKQADNALVLVNNLFSIAQDTNNTVLLDIAEKTKAQVHQLRTALFQARLDSEENIKRAKTAERALEVKTSENLFLKSIKSQDLDEVVSFLHSIGISATTIDNYLTSIYQKINRGIEISKEELKKAIEVVSFENRKILSISRFSTKANFKLYAEDASLDLIEFIREYLINILTPLRSEDIKILVEDFYQKEYVRTFKPIEVSILLDNFVSNSIRAKATIFKVIFDKIEDDGLSISISDNGVGISNDNIGRIFEFGFTTTSGSGLGLYHVGEIVKKLNGTIEIDNKQEKGVKFILNLK